MLSYPLAGRLQGKKKQLAFLPFALSGRYSVGWTASLCYTKKH